MALIGSLAFLGRIEEAVELWKLKRNGLAPALRARVRLTIGLALTRVTRFKAAREYLNENARDPECAACPDVYQGIGGFYYYLGKFEKASVFAKRALRLALENNDDYIRLLATDLLAHVLCETGRRSAGLRLLNQARELQKSKGASDLFSSEYLYYEAQAGARPESIVDELREFLAAGVGELSYARANIILELARQLTLRGRWDEARNILNAEAANIYAHENRRQEVTLQLRLAEIACRQGDGAGAVHFLKAARRRINKIGDRIFELRILGLEHKVERQCFRREPDAASLRRLRVLSSEISHPINARVLNRIAGRLREPVSAGEDPLGDLLDLVARDPRRGGVELLKLGYLGLWPQAKGLRPGEERLFIVESGHWIAVRKAGVVRGSQPLSQTSRKIIQAMSRGLINKESLLRAVWGYDYDPLRHDSMIYAALAALRKSLGPAANWIRTHDMGWSLGPTEISGLIGTIAEIAERGPAPVPAPRGQFATIEDLNWRQFKALSDLSPGEFWTAPLYGAAFSVSLMTAWRDLDNLVKKGYLLRSGHGRLTRYLPGGGKK